MNETHSLPHHNLLAYGVAVEMLQAVRACSIRDATLRDQALRSAKSACLNCAEGAARTSRGEKARAFSVARAEAGEAAAAVEIAVASGDAGAAAAGEVVRLASRLSRMLYPLARTR
ncbi:MAG TPA: four helix bundle protein [Anaeromyxobacteraceae bacterium]|nr:four helix bundle protein [Anaeromyxobacteraceae bacterium]